MNLMDVIRRMQYNIDYIEVSSQEDYKFVEDCFCSKDFTDLITDENVQYNDYLIIRRGDKNIGICDLKLDEKMCVKCARPIIFITHRKSVDSFMAISSLMYHLFHYKNIDRLELRVFNNNSQMLSIANSGIFKYEGCIKYCKKMDDKFISLCFYSILKREFDLLIESN